MAPQASTAQQDHFSCENYFRDVGATSLLTSNEEQDLALRVGEGDVEARDHFVRANLRFVVMIARKFTGRGMTLDDLIQEGNLGLVHAVEHFDPAMKVRFSTYSRYWIQQSIQQAVERTGPTIRVPGYAVDLVVKWRRAANRLHDELGRSATEEEIADTLHLTPRQLKIIQKALRIYNHPGSAFMGDAKDGTNLHDVAGELLQPASSVEKTEEADQVLHLLDKLEDRQAAVVRMRFGLDGHEPMTLKDVGTALGLTRERVRQIESQALAKLQEWLEEAAA
jgi:RNA polymerase primary sigma factor